MAFRGYRFSGRGKSLRKKGFEEAYVVDLINRSSEIETREFLNKNCPPLPPNFEPQIGEPEAVRAQLARTFKEFARENWTEEDWRFHRWMYARLTEQVDADIQRMLDALKESGQEEIRW